MLGEGCSAAWLSECLARAPPRSNEGGECLLLLDLRPPAEYRASHVRGAQHLALPTLMLRRLDRGHLPIGAVLNCMQRETGGPADRGAGDFADRGAGGLADRGAGGPADRGVGELADRGAGGPADRGAGGPAERGEGAGPWRPADTVVLIDEICGGVNSPSLEKGMTSSINGSHVTSSSNSGHVPSSLNGGHVTLSSNEGHVTSSSNGGHMTSSPNGGHVTSSLKPVVSLLLLRLKEDGHKARWLEGGFKSFSAAYPHLCVSGSSPTDPSPDLPVLGLSCLRLSGPPAPSGHPHPSGSPHPSAPPHPTDPALPSPGSRDDGCVDCDEPPSPPAPLPVEVLPHLYLGDAQNSSDLAQLQRRDIRYIVNVTPNVPNKFSADARFRYLRVPVSDHWSQNLTAHFPAAIAFIDEARRARCGVLVHCLAGISRSVTVILAYLMHAHALSLNDAYDLLKRCKPNISPNFNFMGQLMDYERALRLQPGRGDTGPCVCCVGGGGTEGPSGGAGRAGEACVCRDVIDTTTFFSSPASSLSSYSSRDSGSGSGGVTSSFVTSSSSSVTSSSSVAAASAFDYELAPAAHS